MGMFDTLQLADGREIQFKCFGGLLRTYRMGDAVTHVPGDMSVDPSEFPCFTDFQVMVEGDLYLLVTAGRIRVLDDFRREHLPLINNQGFVAGSTGSRDSGGVFVPESELDFADLAPLPIDESIERILWFPDESLEIDRKFWSIVRSLQGSDRRQSGEE